MNPNSRIGNISDMPIGIGIGMIISDESANNLVLLKNSLYIVVHCMEDLALL